MHTKINRGFTIAELLIVVVIIGILAALVMNMYADAQRQARNAVRINVASSYKKTVLGVVIEKGKIQNLLRDIHSSGFLTACIGKGYPDVNGDGSGDCAYNNSGTYVYASETPSFATEVAKISPVQQISYPKFTRPDWGGITYLAPFLGTADLPGLGRSVYLEYGLEGDEPCELSPLIQWDGAGNYWLPGTDIRNSYVDGDTTICFIHIPKA